MPIPPRALCALLALLACNACAESGYVWEGFEREINWDPDASSAATGRVLDPAQATEGKHGLKLDFTAVTPSARAVWYRSENLDWSPYGALLLDVYNPTDLPALKLGVSIATTDRYLGHETLTAPLQPGWNRDVRIDLKARTFSSAASDYRPVGYLIGRGAVKLVSLHVYPGSATSGWVTVDNMRLERAGLLNAGDVTVNTTLDLTASAGRIDYLPPGMRVRSRDVSTVESFETGNTWTTAQSGVKIAPTTGRHSRGGGALAVTFPASLDGFMLDLPGLETRLGGSRQFRMDVWCDAPGGQLDLVLYDTDWNRYRSGWRWLGHGWNTLIFDFTNQDAWDEGVMSRDVTSRLALVSVNVKSRWPGRLVFDGLATATVSLRGAAKPGALLSTSFHPTPTIEAVVDTRLQDTWYGNNLRGTRSAGPEGWVDAGHVRWDAGGFRTTALWRRRITAMDQPQFLLVSPYSLGNEITGAETAGRLAGTEVQAMAVSRLEYGTFDSRVPTGLGPERVGALRLRRNVAEGTRIGVTRVVHLSRYPGTVGEVARRRDTTGLDAESHLQTGKLALNVSAEGAYTSGPAFRAPDANAPARDRWYGAGRVAPEFGRLSLWGSREVWGYDFDGTFTAWSGNWQEWDAGGAFLLEGLPGLQWLSRLPLYNRTFAKDLKVSVTWWDGTSRDRFTAADATLKPRSIQSSVSASLANDYEARPNFSLTADRFRSNDSDYLTQETEEKIFVRVPLPWELILNLTGELSQTAERDFWSEESGTGWKRIVEGGLARYFLGNLYVTVGLAWRRTRNAWEGVWGDRAEHARLTAGIRQALGPNSLVQIDFGQPALYGTDFGSRDTLNVVTVLVKTYI
ncbi:MAG: hypothetical protein AAB152_00475 [Candidatus Coatesbacteria bacterium]